MTSNRRQFTRIPFQSEAHIFLPNGEFAVELVDLSLKGALIRPRDDLFVTVGSNCILKIRLADAATSIRMDCTVVHHQGAYFGLACREIDLDSVTHLRRLVALNLGDEVLLEREISLLSKP
jgi:hypothetical protein